MTAIATSPPAPTSPAERAATARAAQGLPRTVADPAVLAVVAAILRRT